MNLILGRRVLANGLILATTIITCSSLQADEKETKQQPNPATAQSGERANGGANRDLTTPNEANRSNTSGQPGQSGQINQSNPSSQVNQPNSSYQSNQANPSASAQSMFVQKALKGGQMEIRMGQLAQQKGQNQEVKNLGEALVRDHTAANEKLQQIAQSLNISGTANPTDHRSVNSANPGAANSSVSANSANTTASASPDRAHDASKHQAHEQAMSKLESQSGAEFDKEFVRMAIKHHKKDIAAFEQAERQLNDAQLKSFIEGTLPKLRQHLQMAQMAARNVGVDPSTIINDDWDRAPGTGAPAAGQIGTEPSNSNPGLNTGSSAQNGGAVSTEVKVGDNSFTTDADVKTDADANGKVFEKGDGKVLGLPTSKTDGKYLGIPVPDGKKDSADANVDVEVNKK